VKYVVRTDDSGAGWEYLTWPDPLGPYDWEFDPEFARQFEHDSDYGWSLSGLPSKIHCFDHDGFGRVGQLTTFDHEGDEYWLYVDEQGHYVAEVTPISEILSDE